MMTNNNIGQTIAWQAKYDPFGNPVTVTSAITNNQRLPGQWFQIEDGLSYNWHRTYDPSLGRYTQADPLGFVDGPSVYGYAGQSPVMRVDPRGLNRITNPLTDPRVCGAFVVGIGLCVYTPICREYFGLPTPNISTPTPPMSFPPFLSTPDQPYAGKTPDDKPMRPRGKQYIDPDNDSVWEKDRTKHGGSKWKRWPDQKAWEKDRDRESVRPDGSVR
jgi:RHS repeat-associated protein